jgi:protein-disulfide isomerase
MRIAVVTILAVALSLASTHAQEDPDSPARTPSGKVVASTNPKLAPAMGPNPAKVYVVIFSDFQCPVCKRIEDATHQIAEEWPGEVRVEFRELPLRIHANAENAATAALAAHLQGRFWDMHDMLFEHQGALDEASLMSYAEQVGCDMPRFRKDYADPKTRERARADAALGAKLGAEATPSILVNGKLTVGWASWNAFRGQVDQERQAVDALLKSGTKLAAVHEKRARLALKDDLAFAPYKAGIIDPLTRGAKVR